MRGEQKKVFQTNIFLHPLEPKTDSPQNILFYIAANYENKETEQRAKSLLKCEWNEKLSTFQFA